MSSDMPARYHLPPSNGRQHAVAEDQCTLHALLGAARSGLGVEYGFMFVDTHVWGELEPSNDMAETQPSSFMTLARSSIETPTLPSTCWPQNAKTLPGP